MFSFNRFKHYNADWGIGGSYSFLTIEWKCDHCRMKLEGETAYEPDVPEGEEQRLIDLPPMTYVEAITYQWPYEYKRMNP
jgi:hypothetical protein